MIPAEWIKAFGFVIGAFQSAVIPGTLAVFQDNVLI
jgi:hypothetical protein